ncbi:MAG TPA: hypothetical protein VGT40_12135 [Methylomirabilota bacterium]|nr:hypothetical protein [Methylomirabilota bacterium]
MYALALWALVGPVTSIALADAPPDSLARKLAEYPGAERGQVLPISEDALAGALPGLRFYVLRFRQYPVAIEPPNRLEASNLFVVKLNGVVEHIRNAQALEGLFRATLAPVTADAQARVAAKAWLRLVEEFHQDGLFQFSVPDDALLIVADGVGGRRVTGKAVVTPQGGNKGEITASLTFDKAGRLVSGSETASLKRGIRPICQATRLLDPDPVVRRMAKQDLLVMGKGAREYLAEQRANAAPELRRAIDRLWQRILEEDR